LLNEMFEEVDVIGSRKVRSIDTVRELNLL
jgi:hypothetical protein